MKFLCLFVFIAGVLLAASPVRPAGAPTEIGGFKLGAFITDYEGIQYSNYLKEVVVNDWHGFRKGIISYGTCAYPGQIIKMRMKYEDSSREFYQTLLEKFKTNYGKPDEWKGDSFGVLYVWKWRLYDDNNRRVNLILQHNLMNENENVGNMVKLSYPEMEEEERFCFIKFCEESKTDEEKERIKQRMAPDWDYMLPR